MTTNTKGTLNTTLWHIGVLIIATVIAYGKVFNAGFLSWDDGEYILHNPTIRGVNISNIKAWFSGLYVGNYHPLTMLSYAVDYMVGGLHPHAYHLTSLLLHICNSCLLYLFIKRLQPYNTVALVVAFLFSLHPSQTEGVSWVAERKTVLSGMFSLLAMLQYASYAQTPSARKMAWVMLAAVGAMLSKGTAVALPLSLFAIDIWLKRPVGSRKVWVEKTPLLILSLIFGIVALRAQESGRFLDAHATYPFAERCIYAGYAYVQYIVHFFAPVRIAAMYPHPKAIGIVQYLFFLVALCLVILIYISYRRKWHVLCGGIVFYTAHIIFLLQLVPFGEALMADRYMYIACIGLIFPAVYYPFHLYISKTKKHVFATVTGVLVAVLFMMTFVRNTAWQSDTNFFNALLRTFPKSAVAQYSVGAMYLKNGNYIQAELHLKKAIRLDPKNDKAWHNIGLLYLRQRKAMEALDALDRSIAINGYMNAYFSRALLHHSMGNTASALADMEHVLTRQPDNARAWHIKGNCMEQLGNLPAAINCYTKAISYNTTEPVFFIRRGVAYSKTKQHQLAISDLKTALILNPNNGEAQYYMAIVKREAGKGS